MILCIYKKGGDMMEKILDVAKYLCDSYYAQTSEKIDEMKLHKLLYFAQRESYAICNVPLFSEKMEGWIHGPVSLEVRRLFYDGNIEAKNLSDISIEAKRIINGVIEEYGSLASWKLRDMSHNEISWLNSRKGLAPNEPSNIDLKESDIQKDAQKVRPFDHTWGMYYDEFDNAEETNDK